MKKNLARFVSFIVLILLIKNLVVFFKNEMFDEEHGPTDEYHITESIKEDSVHTVCDSIDIISMDDRKRRNSIEEIGKSTYDNDQYQSMGGAQIHTAIVLGNLGIPLYPTFNDPEFALNTVKAECSEAINELKTVYGLNDFSDDHLDEYNQHMYAHLDNKNKSEWYDEFNDQFVELSNFFDMSENLGLNHYLVSTAASAKSIPELLSDENFLTTLPYFAIDDLIEKGIIERDEDVGGFHLISFNEY